MNKYVILSYGYKTPDQEIQKAWGQWFESIKDKLVDGGNPFGKGREITPEGFEDLPLNEEALTGYMIINAENMDEATEIVRQAPMITSMRVYEANSM